MKKLFVVLVLCCLSSIANAATPTISNVTGSVATGQTLTITGANMVNNNISSFDPFFTSHTTAYGFEGTSATSDGFDLGPSGGTYVSDVKLMGNKAVKFHSQGAWPAGPGGLGDYVAVNPTVTNSDSGEIWIRFYCRWNLINGAWPDNYMKIMDTQGGAVNQYYLDFAGTSSGQPTNFDATYDSSSHPVSIPGGALKNNRWYTIELHLKSTTPRSYELWVDGAKLISSTPTTNSTVDYLLFGIINLAGTTSSFSLDTWFDGLAFGSSRIYPASTIEISGNGTTWKYQEPVYLSDTSSQIKVDFSGLTGTNYQLRVTNNQQQTSTIYNLSGGGGGGDTQAPTTPSNLAASAVSSNQINLSWLASTDNIGITGYKIYRGGTYITTATGTSYSNTGLSASTTYTYKVSAIDAAGNESGQSSSAGATTQAAVINDTAAPSTTSGLSASATSSSNINLSWTASTDNVAVTGYKIYRGGVNIATTTNTSFSDTGLSASTYYSYKVSAIDAAGNESSQSSSASATTQAETTSGTTLFQENFDNNSFSSRGWYDNTTHGTIVSNGQSGSCLEWAWSQGATKPTNGGSMRKEFTPTDSMYVSYYVKFQSGWRGSQQTYHPHMMLILSDLDDNADPYSGLANNYLDTYIEFVSDVGSPYTIRPLLAIQDEKRVNTSNGTPPNNLTSVTENRSVAYCNTPVSSGATGTCYADSPYYSANTWKASTASVSTNSWHHVEVYFKMNSISGGKGQSNGVMQEWVDGVKVIDHSDVLYRTNQDATKKWAQFVLAPYIGDGAPIAETMWIDELTVSTAPPNGSSVSAPSVTIMSVSPN